MQLPTPTRLDRPVAQWQPGPHGPGHGPHGGGHHWGTGAGMGGMDAGFGMGGGWLLTLLFALAVIALVAAAVYLAIREGEGGEDEALTVLRERYAAGDFDEEEFERRRERLTGGTG